MSKKKRCHLVKMTNEARILKELRVQKGLSMMQAGFLINKSDSYISHLENGRMDIPTISKLAHLLNIYGVSIQEFQNKVKNHIQTPSYKEQLVNLLNKLDEAKIQTLTSLAKQVLETGSFPERIKYENTI
jgi:transcriptional regulator with XRE-family HTH domain